MVESHQNLRLISLKVVERGGTKGEEYLNGKTILQYISAPKSLSGKKCNPVVTRNRAGNFIIPGPWVDEILKLHGKAVSIVNASKDKSEAAKRDLLLKKIGLKQEK